MGIRTMWSALMRHLNIKTIRGKFIMQTTILTIIPMAILSSIFYQISLAKLKDNARYYAVSSLNAGKSYMSQAFADQNSLLDVILANEALQALLSVEAKSDYTYLQNYKEINKIVESVFRTKTYFQSFVIYTVNGIGSSHFYRSARLSSDASIQEVTDSESSSWMSTLLQNPNATLIHTNSLWFDKNKSQDHFYVTKLIRKYYGDYQNLGYITVAIDKRQFFKDMELLTGNPDSQVMVIDSDLAPVYQFDPANHQDLLSKQVLDQVPWTEASGRWTVKHHRKSYNVFFVEEKISRWRIAHYTESAKLFEKDAIFIRNSVLLVFTLMLVIGVLLAMRFGNMISKPLLQLQKMMRTDHADKFNYYKFDEKDEVGQIGLLYIRLVEENNQLNRKIIDALIQRNEADISALQSQINPHFLYNTLESLKWLAISRNQKDISDIINTLGDFFRITINKGHSFISIAREIEHANAYMTVQNFRYRDKVDLIVEVNEQLLDHYIPKFIFQPIIENSLYHGLKPRSGKGTIMLTGDFCNDGIEFLITDDGIGLSEDRLMKVLESLDGEEQNEVYGLINVHKRLKLRFGNRYGISIVSQEGTYTTVSIRIPTLTEAEVKHIDVKNLGR